MKKERADRMMSHAHPLTSWPTGERARQARTPAAQRQQDAPGHAQAVLSDGRAVAAHADLSYGQSMRKSMRKDPAPTYPAGIRSQRGGWGRGGQSARAQAASVLRASCSSSHASPVSVCSSASRRSSKALISCSDAQGGGAPLLVELVRERGLSDEGGQLVAGFRQPVAVRGSARVVKGGPDRFRLFFGEHIYSRIKERSPASGTE